MSIIYRLLVVFLRILLQAQIGADPQNIRLAYCIQYKADDSLIWYIVVGAVGAASLLALVVVAMSCVRHRRNDDTYTTEAQDDFGTQDVVHRNTPVISDVRPTSLFPLSMFPDDELSARIDETYQNVVYRSRPMISDVRPLSVFPDDEPSARSDTYQDVVHRIRPVISDFHPTSVFPYHEPAQTETSFQDVVRRGPPVISDVRPLSMFPYDEPAQMDTSFQDVVCRVRPVISDFRPTSMFPCDEPTPD